MGMHNGFEADRFVVRRKVFTLLGAAFHVYDDAGRLLLYSRQKMFRLKEDLRLYTREDMQEEVLRVHARNVIDFGATYDVFDSRTNERIGGVRRRGLKSMVRDEWAILGPEDQELARIVEDHAALALLRRVIDITWMFIPQGYTMDAAGIGLGAYTRRRNPFVHRVEGDFSVDRERLMDRRLAMVGALLLCAIEGRQE